MSFDRRAIPAFLSIDVEPDAFQLTGEPGDHWPGYAAVCEFIADLRQAIAQASGVKPAFGWYFRTDPQIGQVFGRADFALTAYPERVAALREEGDYFGVHAHTLRWSETRRLWVHDFGDRQWQRHCTQFALDAFAAWNGAPAQLFRAGAGFLSNEIVDVLDTNGVAADLSLEPVDGRPAHATWVGTAIDRSPMVGEFTNCMAAPKTPYRPSRADFLKADPATTRRILMIPLSAGTIANAPRGRVAAIKRRLRQKLRSEPIRMLYPAGHWEAGFWNVVSHHLDAMQRPYLSLAIRTDSCGSLHQKRVFNVLRQLARHALVHRLRFINPLDVKDQLAPPRMPATGDVAAVG